MSDLQVNIRTAQPADIDRLVALLAALFAIEQDFVADAARQRQGLALMLANQRGLVLVAEVAGQVVGMCSGQLLISTTEGGLSMLVEDVVVDKPWRSRGVGRQLMAALSDWARVQKASRLQLLADRNNQAALTFYQRLGWQTTELICLRSHTQQ